jgi:hypothetical protein
MSSLPNLSRLTLRQELSTNELTGDDQAQVIGAENKEYGEFIVREWEESSRYPFRNAQEFLDWKGYFENIVTSSYEGRTTTTRPYLFAWPETTPAFWRRDWNKFLYDVRRELTRTFASKIIYPNNVGKPLVYAGNKEYITYPAAYYSAQDGPNGTLYSAINNRRFAEFLFNKLRDPPERAYAPTPWPNSERRNTIFVDGSNALFEKRGCRDPSLKNSEGTLPAKPRPQPRHPIWNGRGSVFMVMKKDSFDDDCVQSLDKYDNVTEYKPNFLRYLSSMTEPRPVDDDNRYNVVVLAVDLRRCEAGYERACLQNAQKLSARGEKMCHWKLNGISDKEPVKETGDDHFWCETDDNLLLYLFGQLLGYNNVVTVATADNTLYRKSMVKDGQLLPEPGTDIDQQSIARQEEVFLNRLKYTSIGLSLEMYKLYVPPA